MRVFVTKQFGRFARAEGMSDEKLCQAIKRAESGLIDADLGGGLIKQRVARPGTGTLRWVPHGDCLSVAGPVGVSARLRQEGARQHRAL